jgi:hypothetical protein
MGTSSRELKDVLGQKGGIIKLLDFLRKNTDASSNAFSEAFPNIRALAGALDVMGKNAEENKRIFARMTDNTGDLDKAFGAAAKTAQFRLNQALAEMKVQVIAIGEILLPVFNDLLSVVRSVVGWFAGLTEGGKRVTLGLLAMAAALGPVLIALGSMATLIGAISWPIAAVIGLIAALGAAILYIADNWKAIVERISDWSWWKNMLISMIQFLIEWNPFSVMIDAVNKIIKFFDGDPIPNPFDIMSEGLEGLKDKTKEYEHQFKSFGDSLSNTALKVANSIGGLFGGGGGGGGGGTGGGQGAPAGTGAGGTDNRGEGDIAGAFPGMEELIAGYHMANEVADEYIDKAKIAADISVNLLGNAFDGLGNAIISGMEQGESALQSFGQFFIQFAKGLLAKLISLIVAATILSVVLASLGFGAGASGVEKGIKFGKSFTNILKGGLGLGGGVQGLASGGFVSDGGVFKVHKDELLTLPKGSAVTPANIAQGGNMSGLTLEASLGFDEILFAVREAERKEGNTT